MPLLLVVLLMGCGGSTKRLTTAPHIDLPAGLTASEEKLWRMSAQETQALGRSGLLYQDPEVTAYVQALGERLLPADPGPATYRFYVLRDPEANAFAMPDGAIYVHLGLLALLEREDHLAYILAHEITHVDERHSVEGYDNVRGVVGATQVLSLAAAIGFGSMGTATAGLFNGVSQLGLALTANVAVNGHGRGAEREADEQAVASLDAHGLDPCAGPEAFALLLDEYDDPGAVAAFFYSDHPRLEERQAYSRAAAVGRAGACDEAPRDSAYAAVMRAVRADQVALWVDAERYDRAVEEADRLLDRDAEQPALWLWRAEAVRRSFGEAAPPDSTAEEAAAHYRYALELDSTLAEAHRGLGALYEAQGRAAAAAEAYERYLATAERPMDRRYIRHRIETLTAQAAPPLDPDAPSAETPSDPGASADPDASSEADAR